MIGWLIIKWWINVLIWHYELSGCFSVKSGYRVEKDAESLPSYSNNDRLQGWWNTLWKLKIPLKVKIFIWKSCFDWILAMSNLVRHGMQVVDVCPVCFSAGESTIHALWGCSKLRCARKDWLPSDVKVRSLYANFFWFDFRLPFFVEFGRFGFILHYCLEGLVFA